jgi:hypothetical protein
LLQIVDRPGLPPAICFICEMKPVGRQTIVDTKRDFEPGGPTYLNGRKYVCEACAHEMAKLYGWFKGSDVVDMKTENEFLRARVSELEDRARQVAEQILGAQPIDVKVRKAKAPVKKAAKADVSEA